VTNRVTLLAKVRGFLLLPQAVIAGDFIASFGLDLHIGSEAKIDYAWVKR
jgi:hypothetical protein